MTFIFQNQPVAMPNQGTLEFPPLNSYHRMLVHRTARYYSLKHWVVGREEGSEGRPKVVLWVEEPTNMPLLKFTELIEPELLPTSSKPEPPVVSAKNEVVQEEEKKPDTNAVVGEKKFKIMKRPKEAAPFKENKEEVKEASAKSLKEKEAEYEETRRRLFADVPSDPEEYPEAVVNDCDGDEDRNSSYFDYQYHVPFYPSNYHHQKQQQQHHNQPATSAIPSTAIQQQTQNQQQQPQRTKYVETLSKIPLPRHILNIAIGYSPASQKRLAELNVIVREDRDNLIALFPDSEMAQAALKSGLGKNHYSNVLLVNVSFAPWTPDWFPIQMLPNGQC